LFGRFRFSRKTGRRRMADFEARAEAAYAAMYDAPPYLAKDHKDDASMWLSRAIDEAKALNLNNEVLRLTARRDHIRAVYDRQFRYAGR
jgi:hypothetical protein